MDIVRLYVIKQTQRSPLKDIRSIAFLLRLGYILLLVTNEAKGRLPNGYLDQRGLHISILWTIREADFRSVLFSFRFSTFLHRSSLFIVYVNKRFISFLLFPHRSLFPPYPSPIPTDITLRRIMAKDKRVLYMRRKEKEGKKEKKKVKKKRGNDYESRNKSRNCFD